MTDILPYTPDGPWAWQDWFNVLAPLILLVIGLWLIAWVIRARRRERLEALAQAARQRIGAITKDREGSRMETSIKGSDWPADSAGSIEQPYLTDPHNSYAPQLLKPVLPYTPLKDLPPELLRVALVQAAHSFMIQPSRTRILATTRVADRQFILEIDRAIGVVAAQEVTGTEPRA